MNVLKKIWLDARLKRGLTRNGCRLDSGIQGLRGQVRLVLEHNVKLHDIKIYAPELHIGAYTDIVSGSELHDVSHIGRYCSIAGRVVIGQDPRSHPAEWLSTSHAMQKARFARQPRIDAPPAGEAKGPATVGHDVWIGRDVLIMKGVAIGTGAIIGARSVVTKDVPPYAIVVGSPARVVRYRFEEPARQALIASHWWEYQLGALADLAVESPLEFLRQLRSRSPLPVANVPRLEVTNDPLHIHFKAGVASEHQPADAAQRFAAPPAQGDVSQNAPG